MKVRVRLYATLARSLPGLRAGEPVERNLAEGATVDDLVESVGLPPSEVRLVFVNGLSRAVDQTLAPGDEVGLFPPIGGGA